MKELGAVSDTPRLDAEVLMRQVLRVNAAGLIARSADCLNEKDMQAFRRLLERRITGEPIAYITGEREFWSLSLRVTPDTLIPRPETERLVELALARIPVDANWTIVDLGTGTGAIALAIARERPRCQLIATDQSRPALAVARENAQIHGIENIRFVHADWLDFEHEQRYPLIVSNPPYIENNDPHLEQGDVRFEPDSALASGVDGLDDIRRIAEEALPRLTESGCLLLECGHDQGKAATALLRKLGYEEVFCEKDLAGRDRVLGGCRAS